MKLTFREARIEDLDEMAKRPSATLREEFSEFPRDKFIKVLERSVDTMAWLGDGELGVLAGILPGPPLTESGLVWVMTTDTVAKHGMRFLQYVREYLHYVNNHYSTLYCTCLLRGTVSDRWLRALGFKPYGEDLRYRHYIYRRP